MSWVAAAIIGGSAIVGGLGYLGAKEAGRAQAGAAETASDAQLRMYLQSREDIAPWREAGARALLPLERMAIGGPGEFIPSEQPGYRFGYKEFVERPLLQRASAMGKLRSGETLRALSERASDYASLSYDNWLNRWITRMQPLQSLAGLGQTSTTALGGQGVLAGQGIAQSALSGGQARAGQAINQANVLSGALMGGTRNYLDYLALQKMGGGNLLSYSPGTFQGVSPSGTWGGYQTPADVYPGAYSDTLT